MGKRVSIKTICVALGITLFAVLIIFAGMKVYYRWASVQYFGKIVEIKNGGFLMQTDDEGEKFIATSSGTVIRKGRRPAAESLRIGDYLIVVGAPDKEGAIKADVIRVVNVMPPPKK